MSRASRSLLCSTFSAPKALCASQVIGIETTVRCDKQVDTATMKTWQVCSGAASQGSVTPGLGNSNQDISRYPKLHSRGYLRSFVIRISLHKVRWIGSTFFQELRSSNFSAHILCCLRLQTNAKLLSQSGQTSPHNPRSQCLESEASLVDWDFLVCPACCHLVASFGCELH